MQEIFLKYKPERDVVFVLGAGASYPDGVPLQRHLLPLLLSDKDIRDSALGRPVFNFIKDNFAYDSEKNLYPQLEAVFGFLDYFIIQNESLNSTYTNSEIRKIKEYLIKLIHFIVNLHTNNNYSVYKRFWGEILKRSDNFSIITLNYDTLLEQAFRDQFQNIGFLDYCFHLMNYEKNSDYSKFNFWVNPREPVRVEDGLDPVSIKIIKLHGSLTWKYCNCCNQTLLTPWDSEIDLSRGKFTGLTYPEKTKYDFVCPGDGTEFETLIMMPSYMKPLTHPVISQLHSEASRELRIAKKVVFIGYSLSNADLHIRALFKKQLDQDVKVYVINSRNTDEFKLKYLSISDNPVFHHIPFEEFLEDKNLLDEIL